MSSTPTLSYRSNAGTPAHTFCQLYIIISYVFNHCDLQKTIPKYYHFVNVTSRGNNFLHKCYSNIMNAYAAVSKPHFGNSDLRAILLQPTYIKRLKAVPVTARTGKMWTDDAITELQGCLEATNMTNFRESTDNILWVCRQSVVPPPASPSRLIPYIPTRMMKKKFSAELTVSTGTGLLLVSKTLCTVHQ